MSNKKIILFSLILGFASAIMVFLYLNEVKNASSNINYKKVVTAKKDIPAKTQITKDMLEVKEIPKDYINSNTYINMSDIENKFAKSEIATGEQVLQSKIAGEKDISQGMVYSVTKGNRAITVSVNQVTGINAFVKPGDHVDVAVTMDIEVRNATSTYKQTESKIIVQDIPVLAVEKMVDDTNKDKNSKDVELKTITLLVPVDDTRAIMLANDKGILHLMLRSPADSGKGTTEPFGPERFLVP